MTDITTKTIITPEATFTALELRLQKLLRGRHGGGSQPITQGTVTRGPHSALRTDLPVLSPPLPSAAEAEPLDPGGRVCD